MKCENARLAIDLYQHHNSGTVQVVIHRFQVALK